MKKSLRRRTGAAAIVKDARDGEEPVLAKPIMNRIGMTQGARSRP